MARKASRARPDPGKSSPTVKPGSASQDSAPVSSAVSQQGNLNAKLIDSGQVRPRRTSWRRTNAAGCPFGPDRQPGPAAANRATAPAGHAGGQAWSDSPGPSQGQSRSSRSSSGAACRTLTPGTPNPTRRDYMGDLRKGDSHQRRWHSKSASCFPTWPNRRTSISLIRSMTHRNNGHETAAYLMQTAPCPGRTAGLSEHRRGVCAVQEC